MPRTASCAAWPKASWAALLSQPAGATADVGSTEWHLESKKCAWRQKCPQNLPVAITFQACRSVLRVLPSLLAVRASVAMGWGPRLRDLWYRVSVTHDTLLQVERILLAPRYLAGTRSGLAGGRNYVFSRSKLTGLLPSIKFRPSRDKSSRNSYSRTTVPQGKSCWEARGAFF